ncbi:hypothetical protein [Falsiroseomonas sp.]|uniref:hypothetical protein n=1 Tax=Falsiroseomonas sp. TaxID=2870721 RepID=UPI00272179FB|nr:hypothetical protein [Falsiroseomonas sp.]MDO9502865.1 hypothetical protein [Falsiroseomonas sp.]MDP3418222.1 hypothetical protein [Falsiroseomonas sp.]
MRHSATGTVLYAQEGRFRLLTAEGRGLLFILAHDSAVQSQDLPGFVNCQVRVSHSAAPGLRAQIAHDMQETAS